MSLIQNNASTHENINPSQTIAIFILEPVTWFTHQIKWLVSLLNATLSWKGLNHAQIAMKLWAKVCWRPCQKSLSHMLDTVQNASLNRKLYMRYVQS